MHINMYAERFASVAASYNRIHSYYIYCIQLYRITLYFCITQSTIIYLVVHQFRWRQRDEVIVTAMLNSNGSFIKFTTLFSLNRPTAPLTRCLVLALYSLSSTMCFITNLSSCNTLSPSRGGQQNFLITNVLLWYYMRF